MAYLRLLARVWPRGWLTFSTLFPFPFPFPRFRVFQLPRLFVDLRRVNVFIRVLNFRGCSQPISEIFPICGNEVTSGPPLYKNSQDWPLLASSPLACN